ncbi:hypothetical protein JOF56_003714 [Kibdelosporangium banguiense]|uniref:Radical SAM core domain-containing protein n=1 Tax=Kibdelosporangium banguiense TaxID=1365924 RepID=A0ABS4TG30_9PSEU|nr:hypothetical protein [Kibdelosporangium banguiense]
MIDQASDNEYLVVVFTGGEPTLAGANLLAAIKYARKRNLVTRIVTNGYWALSPSAARHKVRRLFDAGLDEINFSTGDEHARFVPLERLFLAARAAIERQLPLTIMVETRAQRRITAAAIAKHPDYVRLRRDHPNVAIPLRESPWMPIEPDLIENYPAGMAADRSNVMARKGCDSVLTTTTIQADGSIAACCGLGMRTVPELLVGHIENTTLAQADERAGNDFLKHWLRVEGPERILAWAAEHDTSIEWEGMYAHRCQACIRLYRDTSVRRVIKDFHSEKIVDVIASEYILFYAPEGESVSND